MTNQEMILATMTDKEFHAFLRWMQIQQMFKTLQEGLTWWAMLKKQAANCSEFKIEDMQIN